MTKRILVAADASGPGHGGVPVYNQRLIQALVTAGHKVTLLTVEGEYSPKGHEGCEMATVPAQAEAGGAKAEPRETLLNAVRRGEPTDFGLPAAGSGRFDMIIGHSRFSGPAAVLAKRWYPDAKTVWVLHTNVERLGKLKGDPFAKVAMNAAVERLWMPRADLVVGPGPLLTSTASALAADGAAASQRLAPLDIEGLPRHDVPHLHEMVTGTDRFPPVALPLDRAPATFQLLLLGRATDPIKGMDTALRAVHRLRRESIDVRLNVRGVGEKELDAVQESADAITGDADGARILPFTQDEQKLVEDVKAAHLLIVPSLNEGFPLTALEALGRAVPVLVNEDNGVADFFFDGRRVDADLGPGFVVKDKNATREARVDAWEAALRRVLADYPSYVGNASRMRELLGGYDWSHAAQGLVRAADATHGREARTTQAAAGEVTSRPPAAWSSAASRRRKMSI